MHRSVVTLPLIGLLAACTANAPTPVLGPTTGSVPSAPLVTEVVPHSRYTLVSIEASELQRDLLAQIIDVQIPATLDPTVEEALHHVLQRSGFTLCEADNQVQVLYRQPLPAAHYQLGPVRLREALQLLAGPAWRLQVDQAQRRLCFQADTHDVPTLDSVWENRP